MNPFKRKTPPPSHAMTMVDVLANINVDDQPREEHQQVNNFQMELGDRITHADYRDAELTKRIDFLLEERRQVRVVRDGLLAARATAAEAIPAISEGALSAELDINYG